MLLSAVPALAFMALVKLVFTTPAVPAPVAAPSTAPPTVDERADLDSPEPARAAAVVPITAGAFTRANRTPTSPEAAR